MYMSNIQTDQEIAMLQLFPLLGISFRNPIERNLDIYIYRGMWESVLNSPSSRLVDSHSAWHCGSMYVVHSTERTDTFKCDSFKQRLRLRFSLEVGTKNICDS